MRGEKPPLAFQLVFLGKHLGHLLEHRLANRGLNRTQTIILTALDRHPGLQAQHLCAPSGVEPANVTRTLQSLERMGLLERRPHPTDGRASTFYLSEAGQALAEEVSQEMKALFAELLEGIDPQDLPVVDRFLGNLWRNVWAQFLKAGYQPPIGSHQHSAVSYQPSAVSYQPSTAGNGAEADSAAERQVNGNDPELMSRTDKLKTDS